MPITIDEARTKLNNAGIMFTRADYMNHGVDHHAYYSQFVTPRVVALVERNIGTDAIVASTDPHFNDIPLHKWDALESQLPSKRSIALAGMFTQNHATAVPWCTPSDCLCTLKAAAKIIKARALTGA